MKMALGQDMVRFNPVILALLRSIVSYRVSGGWYLRLISSGLGVFVTTRLTDIAIVLIPPQLSWVQRRGHWRRNRDSH